MIEPGTHRHTITETIVGATTARPDGGHVTRYTDRCVCGARNSYSHHTDARGLVWMGIGIWTGGTPEQWLVPPVAPARADGFDQAQIEAAKAALLAPAKPRHPRVR